MKRHNMLALEYHLAHGCHLSCQQCSHYSKHRLAGKLPAIEEADTEYSKWSPGLKPKRYSRSRVVNGRFAEDLERIYRFTVELL